MNPLSPWLLDAADGRLATVPLLLGKLTLLLGAGWLIHAALRGRNPRWRIVLWRTVAVGCLLLSAQALFPAGWNFALLPPSETERSVKESDLAHAPGTAADDSRSNLGDVDRLAQQTPTGDPPRREPLAEVLSSGPGAEAEVARKQAEQPPTFADSSAEPTAGLPASRSRIAPEVPMSPAIRLLAVWSIGLLLGAAHMSLGLRRLHAIRRRSTAVPSFVADRAAQIAASLQVTRPFALRRTDELQSPCLVGLAHPLILLPAGQCDREREDELAPILAHELAHLKGKDALWNSLLHTLSLLLWFHPLVWRVRAAHADACDAVCDALAADHVGDTAQYGRTLARLALRITAPEPSAGLAMARKSSVQQRIEALHRKVFRDGLPARSRVLAVGAATAAILALGSVAVTRSQAEPQVPATFQATNAEQAGDEGKEGEPAKAEELAEGGVLLLGEVVSGSGEAVAGALVVVNLYPRMWTTTTDDRGTFRFEGVRNGPSLVIAASHGNLVSATKQPVPAPGTPAFIPIRLVLVPGKEVKVIVTSTETGQPQEGAEVHLGLSDGRRRLTGSDGTVIVGPLYPSQALLVIDAPRHVRQRWQILDLSNPMESTTRSVALDPAGSATGHITDENGKEVPGATIRFTYRPTRTPTSELSTADENGEYRNVSLPLEMPITASITLDDYLPQSKPIKLSKDERDVKLDFRLERRPHGGSIPGVIVDSRAQKIAGARVLNLGRTYKREATTDQEGKFVLRDLLEGLRGEKEIYVLARGFAPQRLAVEPGPADGTAPLLIKLETGRILRGRVESADGEPLQGAHVAVAVSRVLPARGRGEAVRTGEDGSFVVDSLAEDSRFEISAPGYTSLRNLQLPLDDAAPAVVTLEPIGTLSGKVVDDESGRPVVRYRVRLNFSVRMDDDPRGTLRVLLTDPGLSVDSNEGAFRIGGLMNRIALSVTIEADGYETLVVPRAVAGPENEAMPIEFRLKKQPSR